MAKFRVRLESPDFMQDSGEPHFRVVQLAADDEDHARRMCEQNERRLAAHQYGDEQLADLEAAEAEALKNGGRPAKDVRGRLAAHRQELPYNVVSVLEVV